MIQFGMKFIEFGVHLQGIFSGKDCFFGFLKRDPGPSGW